MNICFERFPFGARGSSPRAGRESSMRRRYPPPRNALDWVAICGWAAARKRPADATKPALLGDAFEALVAAIYLDGGLEPAREFVTRTLIDAAIEAEGSDLGRSDRKSELQELLQARGLPPARYELVRASGPDHQKMFWVEVNVPGLVSATGTGTNKKEAEQSAAEQALEQVLEQVQSSKT